MEIYWSNIKTEFKQKTSYEQLCSFRSKSKSSHINPLTPPFLKYLDEVKEQMKLKRRNWREANNHQTKRKKLSTQTHTCSHSTLQHYRKSSHRTPHQKRRSVCTESTPMLSLSKSWSSWGGVQSTSGCLWSLCRGWSNFHRLYKWHLKMFKLPPRSWVKLAYLQLLEKKKKKSLKSSTQKCLIIWSKSPFRNKKQNCRK